MADLRVILIAVALCAVSFLAGLAGDFASAPPVSAAAPVARIDLPPPLPPPAAVALDLVRTPAAEAAPPPTRRPLALPAPAATEKAPPLKRAHAKPSKAERAKIAAKQEAARAFKQTLKQAA